MKPASAQTLDGHKTCLPSLSVLTFTLRQAATVSVLTFLLWFTGDIGGQMGLFIGASILTILELFDYAYEVSVSISLSRHLITPTPRFLTATSLQKHLKISSGAPTIKADNKKYPWHKSRYELSLLLQSEVKVPFLFFFYLFSTLHQSTELLLLSAALSCSGVQQEHTAAQKVIFKRVFILRNGHNRVMVIRNPCVADISSSYF